jgi:hypothetical protein
METEDLVTIPVPKRHLGAIYTFIGSLEGIPSAGTTNGAAQSTDEPDEWPREMIERQYRESPESMQKFELWLADHPGQEFTTTDMADALKVPHGWNSIAGMLGAYGNRVRNRYKRTTFPFQSRWNYEGGEQLHSMRAEVAEIIKAI